MIINIFNLQDTGLKVSTSVTFLCIVGSGHLEVREMLTKGQELQVMTLFLKFEKG